MGEPSRKGRRLGHTMLDDSRESQIAVIYIEVNGQIFTGVTHYKAKTIYETTDPGVNGGQKLTDKDASRSLWQNG